MEEENGNGKVPTSVSHAEGEALISMKNIWKTYQMGTEELHALRDVSFEVKRNEYLAIIGPSGDRKSVV